MGTFDKFVKYEPCVTHMGPIWEFLPSLCYMGPKYMCQVAGVERQTTELYSLVTTTHPAGALSVQASELKIQKLYVSGFVKSLFFYQSRPKVKVSRIIYVTYFFVKLERMCRIQANQSETALFLFVVIAVCK